MRLEEFLRKYNGQVFGFSVALLVLDEETAKLTNTQIAATAHAIKILGIAKEPFYTGISLREGSLEGQLRHCANSCVLNMQESIRVFGPQSRFKSPHYEKAIIFIDPQHHQLAEKIFNEVFLNHMELSIELISVSNGSAVSEATKQEEAVA